MNTVVPTKCRALYQAFANMQAQGTLKSLADAEQMLITFGAKVEQKNTIDLDLLIFGQEYQERLFEYMIPLHDGSYATFYVDKNLGFGCGDELPDDCKKAIRKLHIQNSQNFLSTIH